MQRREKLGLIGAASGVAMFVGSCLYEKHWEAKQPEIRYVKELDETASFKGAVVP